MLQVAAEVVERVTMEGISVKQGKPTLVRPSEETEKGLYFLSNLDQNIAVIVKTIYCFKREDKGNERAGEVIKSALEKVLVHYYPLAGRLTISPEGKLIVDCNGEGAVFIEAEADCTMEEIGDITKPDPVTLGKLVYDLPHAKNLLEMPPLVAQVWKSIHTTNKYRMFVAHVYVIDIFTLNKCNIYLFFSLHDSGCISYSACHVMM